VTWRQEIINGSYDLPGIPYAKTQGIPNKGGAKIVLKFYDTQGSPKSARPRPSAFSRKARPN
jgi:hypothetical protein